MSTEYERVREEAVRVLDDVWHNYYNLDFFQEAVRRILKTKGIEIKADDQTIVIPCYQDGDEEKCTYINAEPPSWITDAGFVKVVKEGT